MKAIIEQFDKYLAQKGLSFNTTVIGGASLIIMGVINRATKDIDCLDPDIPKDIKEASVEFSKIYKEGDISLKEDWFNNGPVSLKRDLPPGWQERTVSLYQGTNLVLRTLGRLDLLRSKLFAYCDRQQDLGDCVAMKPTSQELLTCYPWLIERDANPLWPEHVKISLKALARNLGYEYES